MFIVGTQSYCSLQIIPGAQNTPCATEGETEQLELIAIEDLSHIKGCELSEFIMV